METSKVRIEVELDREWASELVALWDAIAAKLVQDLKTVDVWVDGEQVRRTPR